MKEWNDLTLSMILEHIVLFLFPSKKTHLFNASFGSDQHDESNSRYHDDWTGGHSPAKSYGPLGVCIHAIVFQLTVGMNANGENGLRKTGW